MCSQRICQEYLQSGIKFCIELVLRTASMHKAPYRMVSVELKGVEATSAKAYGQRLHLP
jgi:hypothetical protein